jgi:hypothetical protein
LWGIGTDAKSFDPKQHALAINGTGESFALRIREDRIIPPHPPPLARAAPPSAGLGCGNLLYIPIWARDNFPGNRPE